MGLKIEMEVDVAAAHELLSETLLKEMTPEKRQEMCCRIIEAWLHDTKNVELDAFKRRFEYLSADSYKQRELEKNFVSMRDTLAKEVVTACVAVFKEKVTALVKDDPELQLCYKIVREYVVTNFPYMVQQALVQWFANRFGELQTSFASLWCDAKNLNTYVKEVRDKMNLPTNYMGTLQPSETPVPLVQPGSY